FANCNELKNLFFQIHQNDTDTCPFSPPLSFGVHAYTHNNGTNSGLNDTAMHWNWPLGSVQNPQLDGPTDDPSGDIDFSLWDTPLVRGTPSDPGTPVWHTFILHVHWSETPQSEPTGNSQI